VGALVPSAGVYSGQKHTPIRAQYGLSSSLLQRSSSISILLYRSGSPPYGVDSDLWIAALELATVHGWKPGGTTSSGDSTRLDYKGYLSPDQQNVGHDDAKNLARGLERGLAEVPKTMLPLGDGPFGDDNTVQLLKRAAAGEIPQKGEVNAAVEVLSGPPRDEALSLVEFLLSGEFTINPSLKSSKG